MPTYEYRCPDGHDFEQFFRSMNAAASELVCPVCGKLAERRMSAGGGLVFKGSGFYITDYGKDGKKDQRTAGAAGAANAADAKPAAPTESAPAGKSDKKADAASAAPAPAAAPAPKPKGGTE
jgi:putative FmdB family regulatory protein